MNDLQWTDAGRWWLLRSAGLRDKIYTRLFEPGYADYPMWTVQFVLETQNTYVQLDPNLSLDEAKDAAKVLSISRSKP